MTQKAMLENRAQLHSLHAYSGIRETLDETYRIVASNQGLQYRFACVCLLRAVRKKGGKIQTKTGCKKERKR